MVKKALVEAAILGATLGMPHSAEGQVVSPAPKTEMVATGVSKPATYGRVVQQEFGLGKEGLKYYESSDGKMGTYVSKNGIALVVDGGENGMIVSCGVLENGQVKYYTDISGKKEECKDAEITALLDKAFQNYGEAKTPYARALVARDMANPENWQAVTVQKATPAPEKKHQKGTPAPKIEKDVAVSKFWRLGYLVQKGYGLEDAGYDIHDAKDGSSGTYVSNNGVAVVFDEGENFGAVLENGKINYYTVDLETGQRMSVDVNQYKDLKELLDVSFQQYGNPNSAYAKALKEQKLDRKVDQRTTLKEGWHTTKNKGVIYSFANGMEIKANTRVDVGMLMPTPKQNAQGEWCVGSVKHKDYNSAQQTAFSYIHQLYNQNFVYNDLKERAKTENLGETEKTFMQSHEKGLRDMGLRIGKNGELEKTNTLDLTAHFMGNSGRN